MYHQIPVPISAAKVLLLYSQRGHQSVLTPVASNYFPVEVGLQEPLRRGVYVSAAGDLEKEISNARDRIHQVSNPLLAFLRHDAGGTIVISRVFVYDDEIQVDIADNLSKRTVIKYVAPHRNLGHSIFGDALSGNPGYFLTGQQARATLWRIERVEIDAFESAILTLRAVQPLGSLPRLDPKKLPLGVVGQEIRSHYGELQIAVANYSFRGIATHSRSIIEPIIGHLLEKAGLSRGRDLGESLTKVKAERERVKTKELPWLSDLAYHQAHRVRLVHARTHPDRAHKDGRPLSPDLAFSCLEDLKQILLETGIAS